MLPDAVPVLISAVEMISAELVPDRLLSAISVTSPPMVLIVAPILIVPAVTVRLPPARSVVVPANSIALSEVASSRMTRSAPKPGPPESTPETVNVFTPPASLMVSDDVGFEKIVRSKESPSMTEMPSLAVASSLSTTEASAALGSVIDKSAASPSNARGSVSAKRMFPMPANISVPDSGPVCVTRTSGVDESSSTSMS